MPRKPREHTPEAAAAHVQLTRYAIAQQALPTLIRDAHNAGMTWAAIGNALGMSGGKVWHLAHKEEDADKPT